MDKLINDHVDKMEELERQMNMVIDQEVSQINIDEIMKNPAVELALVVANISKTFIDEYSPRAMAEGMVFGKAIDKRKVIKVDNTKDPNKNDDSKDSMED